MANRLKKGVLAVLFLAAVCGAAGCGSAPDAREAGNSIVRGGELRGGDASLGEAVNLQDVTFFGRTDGTTATLSFVSGSRMAEVPEGKISSVPPYTISILPAPYRLKVDLAVDYWDYVEKEAAPVDGLVYETFRSAPVGGGTVSVYFQLADDVSVSAREEESRLIVDITPLRAAVREAYYVGLDAFDAYEQGRLPVGLELTPALCEGLADVLLVSAPLRSQEEADGLAAAVNGALEDSASAERAYTFTMAGDALPQAPRRVSEGVAKEPVAETQDMPGGLPVLVENGRYLCAAPDGTVVYARAYLPESGDDEEFVLREELWTVNGEGNHAKLPMGGLYGVETAAFSPDGKYLAVQDAGISDRLLYVYDFAAGGVMNMGEEGLGNNTASFVWDDAKNVIYAMTGYGTLQLTKYDFSAPDAERITSVEEQSGADSGIALAGGGLYFADAAAGVVYRVDIETGEREQVAEGIDFALSSDGRYMTTLVMAQGGGDAMVFHLVLNDLAAEGAQPVTIAENVMVEKGNYAFGAPDAFYYTTTTYDGVSGEYPFAFLKYTVPPESQFTGETEFLGYSKTGRFVPGQNDGELYIIDYFMRNNYNFCVTYVYRDT